MNNKEIRDALASVFLDAELNLRVKHARSTDSIYLTVSNNVTSFVIRIAHHKPSIQFTKIDDYWINPTRPKVVQQMNDAIGCAALRFDKKIARIAEEVPVEIVSEVCPQIEDKPPQVEDSKATYSPFADEENMIDLANYYAYEGYGVGFESNGQEFPAAEVMAVDNTLEDVLGENASEERLLGWMILGVVASLLLFYCFH